MLHLLAILALSNPRVLVLGDSWAYQSAPDVSLLLASHSASSDIVNVGVPGSFASVWASSAGRTAIDTAFANDPTLELAHIELGLNDLLANWNPSMSAGNTTNLCRGIAANVFAVARYAEANSPTVEVVVLGYDYLNFDDFSCASEATCGFPTATEINGALASLNTELQAVADSDPRMTFVPGLGANGGSPTTPTPAAAMTDCLHLATWGTHVAPTWSAFYVQQLTATFSPSFHWIPGGSTGSTGTMHLTYHGPTPSMGA